MADDDKTVELGDDVETAVVDAAAAAMTITQFLEERGVTAGVGYTWRCNPVAHLNMNKISQKLNKLRVTML